jgi:hypothetical protein
LSSAGQKESQHRVMHLSFGGAQFNNLLILEAVSGINYCCCCWHVACPLSEPSPACPLNKIYSSSKPLMALNYCCCCWWRVHSRSLHRRVHSRSLHRRVHSRSLHRRVHSRSLHRRVHSRSLDRRVLSPEPSHSRSLHRRVHSRSLDRRVLSRPTLGAFTGVSTLGALTGVSSPAKTFLLCQTVFIQNDQQKSTRPTICGCVVVCCIGKKLPEPAPKP